MDLAYLAALRAKDAAALLDDPVQTGKADFMWLLTLPRAGSWDRNLVAAEQSANELEPYAHDPLGLQVLGMERASFVKMAFELYATGQYNYHSLQETLTEAGLRTRGNRRYGPRPVSLHKIGDLLQDGYYLGFVTYDGVEYQGRHDPLISQELFDRVQRVLFNERRASTRQRVHNHYLKGLLWCYRCGQRLIVIPGRSKSGQQYFYYLCRGRQSGTCDFPYLLLATSLFDGVAAALREHGSAMLDEQVVTFVVRLLAR